MRDPRDPDLARMTFVIAMQHRHPDEGVVAAVLVVQARVGLLVDELGAREDPAEAAALSEVDVLLSCG
jgi:hypothetical protein